MTEAKLQAQKGAVHEVLVEGRSKTDPTRETGRSRTNRPVHFPAGQDDRRGRIVSVRITQALKHSLVGEAIGSPV
jgi:tRNA-2-methylthio-N6-dimethylallyladenosine synthase